MSLAAGTRLGPYEIQTPLGSGGMGEVYRARDTKLARDVAIKILPDAFVANPDRLARFEREARLLAALNHPHIGAIYGFEDRDHIHALVLELVEGETLADRLNDGPLPIRVALTIARQIADALEAAHDKGITHRDLKPANVILQAAASPTRGSSPPALNHLRPAAAGSQMSPSGLHRPLIAEDVAIKIIDFGLAKGTDESQDDVTYLSTLNAGRTGAGAILGTAGYMSPEQARGKVVDKRGDIWAFGCIVYEMLTGRKAFAAETLSDTLVAVLERQPDWSAMPHSTPPLISRLIQRCLEKDLRRRLHDIADARIDIEDVSRQLAEPSFRLTPSGPRVWTRVRLLLWASALTAAIVLTAGIAAVLRSNGARMPVNSSALARVMISLPAGESLDKSRFPPLALSPDGKLLIYAASDGGRSHLYSRPLDEITAQLIPETVNASTPFFSPDGRWLAFFANGSLKKVSIAGGVPLTICDAPPVWSAHWGSNDTIVFATTLPSSGLWMVSANGGDPVQITTPKSDEVQHGYPQLLPGGTDVLFSVRRDNGWHLAMLSLKTHDWRLLGNGRVIGEGAQYLSTGHLIYTQAGGLIATPFDRSSGMLDQPPVPLLERLERSQFGGIYFAIAADTGTLVYLPAAMMLPQRTLVRVDRDGRVSPVIEARAAYEQPALSGDGRKLAVTIGSETGNDVWIIDLERSTRIRLTTGGTSAFPVWSLDESKVAFQSTAPGPWNLFVKPADGSTEAQPVITSATSTSGSSWPNTGAALLPGTVPKLSGADPQFPSSWAPHGLTLAFHVRKENGERDIWVVSPGSEPQGFLLTPFDERLPRFSPDGKWLAYVSDESGRDDVYVQPFPGPGAKWVISTDGGTDPVWSRDGRELFYRRDDQLMVAPLSTKAGFSAGRPMRLFEMRFDPGENGPNYDVSPDGKWFVVPRGDREPMSPELHVVLNWFSEVKVRAANTRADHLSRAQPFDAARVIRTFAHLASGISATLSRLWPALLAASMSQTPSTTTEEALRDTLQRYSAAFQSLDANAVKKVQPSIPADTLAKAFKDMRELKVAIDGVKLLSVDASTARVSCRITQTVTPKIGAKQTTTVTRVMRLRRDGDSWVIDAFER